MKKSWYNRIEHPLKDVVKLLRNNGFNTTRACGHLPNPYIEMDWGSDGDITILYTLLIENGYKNFVITARWDTVQKVAKYRMNQRFICLQFYFKLPLAKLSDIKD